MPRSATSVDATLVDLESLIQSTPAKVAGGLDAMLERAEAAQRLGDPRARRRASRCDSSAPITASAAASALATL